MKKSKSVLFVTINYNGWRETIPYLQSVLKQTYADFHIFLTDNGSTDDSLVRLAPQIKDPRITLHKSPTNTGFSGGVNHGIRYAIEHGYDYVAMLNNDATIEPDWLQILMSSIEKTDASSITGLLLNGDGTQIESTGDGYSTWGLPFPSQRDEPVANAIESGYVFGGTAGASLYKTSLFTDIGLFDEKYFMYFEDTDFNLRAQLAGHRSYYEKKAIGYHDHGTSSNKVPGLTVYQTFRNFPVLFWKNTPTVLLLTTGLRFYACYWLMYLRAVLRGQFVIATKGVLAGLLLLPHATIQRWHIQRSRRVTTAYLKTVMYPHLPPNSRKGARRIFHK